MNATGIIDALEEGYYDDKNGKLRLAHDAGAIDDLLEAAEEAQEELDYMVSDIEDWMDDLGKIVVGTECEDDVANEVYGLKRILSGEDYK